MPKKGQASKSMKGKLDFTTKKTSHVFDVNSHFVKADRRPYHVKNHTYNHPKLRGAKKY